MPEAKIFYRSSINLFHVQVGNWKNIEGRTSERKVEEKQEGNKIFFMIFHENSTAKFLLSRNFFFRRSSSFHFDLIIIYDYIGNVAKVQTKINSQH